MNRPSLMHGRGGYPNAGRPSMMHGPGAGHNKNRPSLHPRDRDPRPRLRRGRNRRDYRASTSRWIGLTRALGRPPRGALGPWGAERRHSGAFGAEEDGELPLGGGARARLCPRGDPHRMPRTPPTPFRGIFLKSVSAAPTPTMEPFAGTGPGAQPGAQLARHLWAPASADAGGDPESPAPKRKKLGWGLRLGAQQEYRRNSPHSPQWNRRNGTGAPGLPPCPSPKTRSLRRRTRFC